MNAVLSGISYLIPIPVELPVGDVVLEVVASDVQTREGLDFAQLSGKSP